MVAFAFALALALALADSLRAARRFKVEVMCHSVIVAVASAMLGQASIMMKTSGAAQAATTWMKIGGSSSSLGRFMRMRRWVFHDQVRFVSSRFLGSVRVYFDADATTT